MSRHQRPVRRTCTPATYDGGRCQHPPPGATERGRPRRAAEASTASRESTTRFGAPDRARGRDHDRLRVAADSHASTASTSRAARRRVSAQEAHGTHATPDTLARTRPRQVLLESAHGHRSRTGSQAPDRAPSRLRSRRCWPAPASRCTIDAAVWWKALLALVVASLLQVGVNYANDYSDGIRGTDADRVGPMRLVGSRRGAARARSRRAAFAAFGVAAVAGLVLAATTAWWLVAVGAVCVAGRLVLHRRLEALRLPRLGEVMVFVFFGLVAVIGTTYVQTETWSSPPLYAAVGIGALACAILVANNLRDIPTDRLAGKRTLAVRARRRPHPRSLRPAARPGRRRPGRRSPSPPRGGRCSRSRTPDPAPAPLAWCCRRPPAPA